MNVIRTDPFRAPAQVRTLVWALSIALLCVAVAGSYLKIWVGEP